MEVDNRAIPLLVVRFENCLRPHEVKCFRGAVIQALREDNVLFHNHKGDKLRYAYPLVQYKTIGGHASIVCVDKGVEAIGYFFSAQKKVLMIGENQTELRLQSVLHNEFCLKRTTMWNSYRLRRWLPLNSENYKTYQEIDNMSKKIEFLEKVLVGNILSLGKGIEVFFDEPVECSITEVERSYLIANKGVKVMAFDLCFKCNVRLPYHIGLGKNASIGCGHVFPLLTSEYKKVANEDMNRGKECL